jgi:Glycosyl hydrolase family 9
VVIEGMTYQGATTRSVVTNLTAGRSYDIQIDYFENTGIATNETAGIAGQCVAGLAAASVVLQSSDHTYAQECLTAAQNGWSWMVANPNAYTHDWDGTPGNVLGAAARHT